MASFIGSVDEFMKYINPRAKNVVNSISRRYKNEIGLCQHCRTNTETLEAAHITGRERPVIIEEILNDFTNGEVVTIDLEVFENKFLDAHNPINECILVLCRSCHAKYDSNTQENTAEELRTEETEVEADQIITNSEITEYFRQNIQNINNEEIENLQLKDYCIVTFGINFPVLKKIPMNSTIEEIREYAKINGYNRWSTQRPIIKENKKYLVVTQWIDRHRQPFLNWKNNIKNA